MYLQDNLDKNLNKIAEDRIYDKNDRSKYVKFMKQRFPTINDETYASEWADRFNFEKRLCADADGKSTEILKTLGKCKK